jgi:hypothetical protein
MHAAAQVLSITNADIHFPVTPSKHRPSSINSTTTGGPHPMVFLGTDRHNGPGRFAKGAADMATGTRQDPDITAVPRAVLTMGVRLLGSIQRALGDPSPLDIARTNAWEAVCADRARAAARADLRSRLTRIDG